MPDIYENLFNVESSGNWYDYETVAGETPIEDVLTLKKALTTDHGTDVATFVGGQALRMQSLESLLHTITFREQHLVLWRDIEKDIAFSTVEEYSRLLEYGEYGDSFVGELETPEETSASLDRQVAKVKFLGTIRSVSLATRLVRKIVPDVIGFETYNGAMKLLRDWTRASYWGDSTMARNGEGLEFDGFITIIQKFAPDNIIDAGGQDLKDTHIADLAQIIYNKFGVVNRLYTSPVVAQRFFESYYGTQRLFLPAPTGGISAGFIINQFETIAGSVIIRPDTLFRPPYVFRNSPTSTKAPDTQFQAVGQIDSTLTTANWDKGSITGNAVRYWVCAGNQKGISAPVVVGTSANPNVQAVFNITNPSYPVKITITESMPGSRPADFYVIFREDIEGTKSSGIGYIGRVKANPTGTTTFIDNNDYLPNSFIAVMGDFTRRCLVFARLLNLVKINLPVVGQSFPFMILLYGTYKYYNPSWLGIIRNIGYQRK